MTLRESHLVGDVHAATGATLGIDDLAAVSGPHASAESDAALPLDSAVSTWIVHGVGSQI